MWKEYKLIEQRGNRMHDGLFNKSGKFLILIWVRTGLDTKLWIEETNDLVDIETDISRNLKGLVPIEIATAVSKKSLAAVAIAIWFFETQPRRERELDR